jgi:hypothetical protein
LRKRQQIRALPRVFYARKRHRVSRNEVLRVLDPFTERIVVPDDGRHDDGRRPSAEPREARSRGSRAIDQPLRDTYKVATADGKIRDFWERNLRFKTDVSDEGPQKGMPALVPAGMMGDRSEHYGSWDQYFV